VLGRGITVDVASVTANFWLILGLLIAVSTDIRRGRIYNLLTFPLMIVGLSLGAASGGFHGFLTSFEGLALGFLLLFPFFFFSGIGAGDVKLLMAIGALKGSGFVFLAWVGMALIGGIVASAVLFRQRRLGDALFKMAFLRYIPTGEQATRLPYAIPIALGAIAALILDPSIHLPVLIP
jgi:prepilin peptidase CpaA